MSFKNPGILSKLWTHTGEDKSFEAASKGKLRRLDVPEDVEEKLELLERTLEGMGNDPLYHDHLFGTLSEVMQRPGAERALGERPKLMQKIITSGLDLMELQSEGQEYLYLGAFVDLKVNRHWREWGFYSLVSKALSRIRNGLSVFAQKLCQKILGQLKDQSPELYFTYVVDFQYRLSQQGKPA